MAQNPLSKSIRVWSAAWFCALVSMFEPASAAEHPNLLIIMTDNQSPSLMGTYGNTEIRTPNIDQLAAEGLQFNNAFATSGVCSSTRATFLTGLLPSQHGVHNALPDRSRGGGKLMPESWSAIQEFRSLPQTLADAGYATGLIGKFHLGTHEQPQLGFDYWVTFGSGHTMDFFGEEIFDNGERYTESGHMTDLWTRKAEEFLSRQSTDQPFFLFLSYNGPYMLPPVVLKEPRNRHVDFYRANPPSMPQEPVHPSLMNSASRNKPSPIMFRVGFGGWPQIQALNNRDAMINLASEMSTVDDGIGRVMAALSQYGFDANTLVVLTSDQGSLYGQHGLWGNTSAWWPPSVYDENMRVPLIFRHPNKIKAGTTTQRLANQFDFLPSVLDYLGFADRKISQGAGQSYAAALTGSESGTEQSDVFFEFMTVRAIRTEQWLYQKSFLLGDDALFDLEADPEQRHDRVDDSDYAEVVKMLDTRLTDFFARTADPRYDLWQGGTAKLKLFDGGDNKVFTEKFPGWQPPVLGFEQSVFHD
jgi:arylsulfatase A-like enzyme